ncbi:MAG TPA: vWA domain-containing protein [Vicinamibacterales bacterium]|jgi:Flp pilus assembly protein TadG
MKPQRTRLGKEEGFTLVYMAATLTVMLLASGLALDSGRAYVVKAQLSKAVDGAALAAARSINTGAPRDEAVRVFKQNFPSGWFGTIAGDPTASAGFFTSRVDAPNGVNIVTVTATATLPTTFMKLGNFDTLTVSATGEAQRRMVDLSLVIDVSGSIGPAWGAIRDASRMFINSFDAAGDRVALITFSDGSRVLDQMPSTRGFNKTRVVADVPNTLPGGSTAMVEGLYHGWDELRAVPAGTQSGLRVIVLFTDGASNSVPGVWDASGAAKGLRTYDFPQNAGDTHGQTWNQPHVTGLYDTLTGAQSGAVDVPTQWDSTTPNATYPLLPTQSWHSHARAGTPTAFPLQSSTLFINGVRQDVRRGLRNPNAAGRYPTQVWNINNAARNLVEIIANAARNDNGDYKIRIFTIGMGQLVRLPLGTIPETSESILKRIANDSSSPDFNSAQLEGQYYYAETAEDVGPAFQGIQAQIIRLSK